MLGYNSRETFQDATYDVQTQQLSSPERWIETHVYRNGKIVATVRTYCSDDAPVDSLEERISQQHEETCGKVREGTYELAFLWISRGIIAFESLDYLQALECFESVLSMEETHAEANAYVDKIQASLKKDATSRRKVLQGYQKQIEALESTGRIMEASRKRAVLTRICKTPPRSNQKSPGRNEGGRRRSRDLSFLEQSLRSIRESLLPRITESLLSKIPEDLLPRIKESLSSRIREDLIPRIRKDLLPAVKDNLLPRIRENLLSRHLLVTCSALLLVIMSGLIAADFQIKLDPAYHSSLGREYLEGNRLSQARNLFYGILRQHPESEEALDGFWETFRKEGNYQKAAEMLETLVKSRDSYAQTYFYLAEAYRRSSSCSEAIAHYAEAVERGLPEVPCKIGMGLCLVGQQNVRAAIDLWEGLLRRGFDDYRIDYCLGTAYQANGRLGRASVHYSRALQKRPESGLIYRALGDCLHGLHQQEKAEGLWKKAASLESQQGTEATRCPQDSQPSEGGKGTHLDKLPACFPFPLI